MKSILVAHRFKRGNGMDGQGSNLGKGQWSAVALHQHHHHVYKHVLMHFPCAYCNGGSLAPRLIRCQHVSINTNRGFT